MKSLEQLQTSLQEQFNGVIAVIILLAALWLLRRQITRFMLWLLNRSLDESKQYITKVIEQSVHNFIHHSLLTLIVYIFTIYFVQNARLATFVNNIALTVFLFTLFRLTSELAKATTATSRRFRDITRLDVDRTLMPLIRLVANVLIFIIGLIAIARTWNLDLTTVFAGLGIGGLAISFAAQDTLKNLIGFIVIVSDKPFMLDEYIVTPTATGTVEDIGLRSVKIRCLDQSLVVVPNSTMANEPVTNWSRLEKRWFNFVVALPFTTTAEQVEAFTSEVREMLRGREQVEPDSVLTLFTEYDSSALNVLIRCYVTIPNYAEALTERMAVNLEINRIVDGLGLRFAPPVRHLTFDQVREVALPEQHTPGDPLQSEIAKSGQSGASANVWVDGDGQELDDSHD